MPLVKKVIYALERRLTLRRRNLAWLSFSISFREIAGHLSTFYLPLFLYQIAQDLDFFHLSLNSVQKGMIMICAFYLIERLVVGVVILLQAKLALRVGHNWTMVLGMLLYSLFLLSLTYVQANPSAVFLSSFLAGLHVTFFWPSYYTLVSHLSFKKNMGKNLGGISFLRNLVSMISPAIGGLVIITLGYNYLFYTGICLALISLIGLFQLDLSDEKDEVNLQEYFEWMREKTFIKLNISYCGRFFYEMSMLLWPLYVYLILGNVEKVGYVYSVSLLVAMIMNLAVGVTLDKKHKSKKPFLISGSFLSLLSVFRILVVNVWGVIFVDSCNRVVSNFHNLFHDRAVFFRGKGSQAFSYFIYLKINQSIAAVAFWGIMTIFFFIVPIEWPGLFVLGAVGVLFTLLVKEKRGVV